MTAPLNVKKAAQVAAFFCRKAGREIHVLKLMKLIYLSDRESLAQCGFPITDDNIVSMAQGPVNSTMYNYVKGERVSPDWDSLIGDRANHMIGLARDPEAKDTSELSKFELKILESVWQRFGGMDRFALAQWTHDNCNEWEDPGDSSYPIPYERIFKEVQPERAKELTSQLHEHRALRAALSRK